MILLEEEKGATKLDVTFISVISVVLVEPNASSTYNVAVLSAFTFHYT
jgi:hypothetical protein